jgi:pyruvate dehydrogenase E2 component (dihydrolipoamide acetyltransferase)
LPETPGAAEQVPATGATVKIAPAQEAAEALRASPRARKLAEEKGVDVRQLKGSGPGGRIQEKDVLAFLESQMEVEMDKALVGEETPEGGVVPKVPAHEDSSKDIRLRMAELKIGETVQPLSRLRQIIAERLTKSQQERAHIYLTATVDMTEAVGLRGRLSGLQAPRPAGAEITYNDLFIKALGICLTEYPWVNSSLVSEGLRMYTSANVGIAVVIEDHGLVVPVIQDVQRLTLVQIAGIRQELVKKAKERRLVPDEMAGGTFTLSNLGMYGVEQFTAIINPPETGILAAGVIMEEPRAIQGRVAIRPVMRVTLGVDHRVVDGALAAQFLQCFKTLLEQPRRLTGE